MNACSIGVLSDCTCAQSTFDSVLIYPFPNLKTILSTNSLNVTIPESKTVMIEILIPDTISSVCGNADGFSYCGDRLVSFTDGVTNQKIKSWPYRDFTYDSVTGELILNPATA